MVKFSKMFKKAVTGQESIKDAFSDFEQLQVTIEPYNFMPFDMIVKADEAIEVLLAQREDMVKYNLMKERVPDVGLSRCIAAIQDLQKTFPAENMSPIVKCFAPCGAGGFKDYSMQKLVCFDTMEKKIQEIIALNNEDIARAQAAAPAE